MKSTEQTHVQRQKKTAVLHIAIAVICAAVFTLLLGVIPGPVTSSIAQAQYNDGYSYNSYGYNSGRKYRKRRYRAPRAKRKKPRVSRKRRSSRKRSYAKRPPEKKYTGRKIEGPLTAVVSLNQQRMMVYDAKGLVTSTRVSTGKRGHRTPTGVFSIIQKRKRHYSNLYAGAPMPYMQRITWSGIALHAGVVPGYPASHGCIRLPYSFARQFWKMTKMGARVIITRDGATPRSISHARLLKPLPPGNPMSLPSDGDDISGDPENAAKTQLEQAINSNVNELIGVSTANAATAVNQPRTRASVAQERKTEVARRQQMLVDAEQAFQEAADELKQANLDIKSLQSKIAASKKDHRRHLAAKKNAKRNVSKTVSALKSFFKRYRRAKTEKAIARGIERENELEARLLQHEREIEEARKAALVTEKIINDQKLKLQQQITARGERKINYTAMSKALQAAKKDLKIAKRTLKQQDLPVHVLISRKAKKLYVRQGHQDILEAEISLDFPDAPIGTHVFTATKYINDESDLKWSIVTAARGSVKKRKSKKKKRDEAAIMLKGPAQTPANALDRVEIQQEIRDKLADYLKPGSSLIISDERKSNETGLGTDLIVVTR
ncbi:MAG: L,D-transpeptidase family protein [Hyphomicrobiaceae bacterium]